MITCSGLHIRDIGCQHHPSFWSYSLFVRAVQMQLGGMNDVKILYQVVEESTDYSKEP